jgi:hypothetical protein
VEDDRAKVAEEEARLNELRDSPTTARCYARDKIRHDQTPNPEGGSSFWGRFHTQGVGRSQQAATGPSEIPAGSPRAIRIAFSHFSGKEIK